MCSLGAGNIGFSGLVRQMSIHSGCWLLHGGGWENRGNSVVIERVLKSPVFILQEASLIIELGSVGSQWLNCRIRCLDWNFPKG